MGCAGDPMPMPCDNLYQQEHLTFSELSMKMSERRGTSCVSSFAVLVPKVPLAILDGHKFVPKLTRILKAWSTAMAKHLKTNTQTNGHYQTHYLPCFAVDYKWLLRFLWIKRFTLCYPCAHARDQMLHGWAQTHREDFFCYLDHWCGRQ